MINPTTQINIPSYAIQTHPLSLALLSALPIGLAISLLNTNASPHGRWLRGSAFGLCIAAQLLIPIRYKCVDFTNQTYACTFAAYSGLKIYNWAFVGALQKSIKDLTLDFISLREAPEPPRKKQSDDILHRPTEWYHYPLAISLRYLAFDSLVVLYNSQTLSSLQALPLVSQMFYAYGVSGALYLGMDLTYLYLKLIATKILGHEESSYPPLFNYPFLARNSADFWQRWHGLFKKTWMTLCYRPVVRKFEEWLGVERQSRSADKPRTYRRKLLARAAGALSVFILSGVFHEHIFFCIFSPTWNSGVIGSQILFFITQGLGAVMATLCPLELPRPLAILITTAFNAYTTRWFLTPFMVALGKIDMPVGLLTQGIWRDLGAMMGF